MFKGDHSEKEKVIPLFNMAEAFIDREEELLDKIVKLEKEIFEHNCIK